MAKGKTDALLKLMVEEYQAAVYLGAAFPRQSLYQASQAAEKGARALLDMAGTYGGLTHNFGDLALRLPEGHPLRQDVLDLDFLSSASTAGRYASGERDPPTPSPQKLKKAHDAVKAFCAKVGNHAIAHDRDHASALKPKPRTIQRAGNPVIEDAYRTAKRETLLSLMDRIGHPMPQAMAAKLERWSAEDIDAACLVLVTAAEHRGADEFRDAVVAGLKDSGLA